MGSAMRAEARPKEDRWALLTAALAPFREKGTLSSEQFLALEADIKGQAVRFVGDWSTRFNEALAASARDASAKDVPLEEWVPEAANLMTQYGAAAGQEITGDALNTSYANLVFQQNTLNALSVGALAVMFFGAGAADEYWLFLTSGDEKVCEICAALDGQVFAKIDAAGQAFLPPIHFNCECWMNSMSAADVEAGGYQVSNGYAIPVAPASGFGTGLDAVPAALRRAA